MPIATKSDLFQHLVSEIEREYQTFGHTLGWRFLSVPRSVLETQIEIALITLNPGGDRISPDHPSASCEKGVSYCVEQWGTSVAGKHKLQIQVQKLFDSLNRRLGLASSGRALMERSLIGYFVPFRSPRLADLPKKPESFELGRQLWQQIFAVTQPRLVICIDRRTHEELRRLIPQILNVNLGVSTALPTGWGNYMAEITDFSGDRFVRLLRLPHLSTFQLFSSANCKVPMDVIMDVACDGI